jgi:integrase
MSQRKPKRSGPNRSRPTRSEDGLVPGTRVSTETEGVYRNVSSRGRAYDTFKPRVYDPGSPNDGWLPTQPTLEAAQRARIAAMGLPKDMRFITVGEFVERLWLQLYTSGRVSSTLELYRYSIKRFVRRFGDMRPADISRLQAREWAVGVPINNVRAARAMMSDAADAGLLPVDKNPLVKLRLEAPRGRRDTTPPRIDIVLDMAAMAERAIGPWGATLSALIRFSVATLLRPGEAFELQWTDVDFEEGIVHITRNKRRNGEVGDRKNHKPAAPALLSPGRDALREVPRQLGSPYVFHAPNGKQLSNGTHHYWWRKLRAYAAVSMQEPELLELDFYEATKHAGATWLRNVVGIPTQDLKDQLGHTNDALVDLYSHPEAKAAALRIHQQFQRYVDGGSA